MSIESDAELLVRLTTEVIINELARRAREAGMHVEEFISAARESIRQGLDENAADRSLGHE